MKIKIAGFDPSLSNFGIVHATLDTDTLTFVVDDMKVITTEPDNSKAARKAQRKNAQDIDRAKLLMHAAIHAVDEVWITFIEVPVGSQDARAMASYGVCIAACAAVANICPTVQLSPAEVKIAATGCKTATKEEMIEAMMLKHPEAPWPMRKLKGQMVPVAKTCEHMADAIAAIEAGLLTQEFRDTIDALMSLPLFSQKGAVA